MSKSFKDHVIENTDKAGLVEVIKENAEVTPLREKAPKKSIENSYSNEVIRAELKEEVEATITKQVEDRLRIELTEKYDRDFTQFKQQLNEQLLNEVFNKVNENNVMLVNVMTALMDKVEKLQESLNIELPTPTVNVTMPYRKIERIVHRDSKGHILKITEHDGE